MAARIYRASETQRELAYRIVEEYYRAASVVVREDAQEFVDEYFAPRAGVWLAEVGNEPAGCVALRKLGDDPSCGEIKRLYVCPAYRGQGIADLLLDAVERYAKDSGYQWLYLDTAADMKAAQRFYERKGFARCERYNDNPQAAIFMRKTIA